MIGVTDQAKRQLKKVYDNVDMAQAGIRLVDRGGANIGLGIDIEKSGDKTVEFEGCKILKVEQSLADRLTGITLDVEETEEGPQLVLLGK